jgi:hypothetical protein
MALATGVALRRLSQEQEQRRLAGAAAGAAAGFFASLHGHLRLGSSPRAATLVSIFATTSPTFTVWSASREQLHLPAGLRR